MEVIIAFLEEYWGVTLIGTLTVGTLITFIVMSTITFIQNRTRTTETTQVVAELKATTTTALATASQYKTLYDQSLDRSAVMNDVVVTLLNAVGFIVAASKLTTADKLAVQTEFIHLQERLLSIPVNAVQTTAPVETTVKAVVESNQATEVVKAVVDGVVDLVSKYTTKGV